MESELMTNEPSEQPKPRRKVRFFTVFLVVILFLSAIFATNFKTAVVDGQSMMPTLSDHQKVLTTKAYYLVGAI